MGGLGKTTSDDGWWKRAEKRALADNEGGPLKLARAVFLAHAGIVLSGSERYCSER